MNAVLIHKTIVKLGKHIIPQLIQ